MIHKEIQCSTIANMLAAELKRQNIETTQDEDDFERMVYAGAESILYEGGAVCTDIEYTVQAIKEWIANTKQNYPNYFMTGEE